MSKQFLKIVVSTTCVTVLLVITVLSIKVFGLWSQINFFKLVLTGIMGFATYFFFFSYLIRKLGTHVQPLISPKIIIWILGIIAFVFLVLGALTGFLMLRIDSYDGKEILRVTSVYISVVTYCLGSLFGVYKSSK
ncbi:MAG: hypothetical protein HOP21_08925 [Methylotenera sp.]|nr:hypothetical protein [Methylotenera sp.]